MDNDQASVRIGSEEAIVGVRIAGVEELTAQYVNLVSSNSDQAAIQVVFAQLLPPVVLTPEDAEQISQRGFVEAQAIARIVLTPLMVEQTIQNLTTQLESFKSETSKQQVLDDKKEVDHD